MKVFVVLRVAPGTTRLPKKTSTSSYSTIKGKGQNYENQNVEKQKEHQKFIKASEHRKSFLVFFKLIRTSKVRKIRTSKIRTTKVKNLLKSLLTFWSFKTSYVNQNIKSFGSFPTPKPFRHSDFTYGVREDQNVKSNLSDFWRSGPLPLLTFVLAVRINKKRPINSLLKAKEKC